MKIYYHYTNEDGAMEIRSSGYIQRSMQSGAFGPGVYLTDIDPSEFSKHEILTNNYNSYSRRTGFADWVVKISDINLNTALLDKVNVPGERHRRIFVYPRPIFVQRCQVIVKPRCIREDNYEIQRLLSSGTPHVLISSIFFSANFSKS